MSSSSAAFPWRACSVDILWGILPCLLDDGCCNSRVGSVVVSTGVHSASVLDVLKKTKKFLLSWRRPASLYSWPLGGGLTSEHWSFSYEHWLCSAYVGARQRGCTVWWISIACFRYVLEVVYFALSEVSTVVFLNVASCVFCAVTVHLYIVSFVGSAVPLPWH
jgi:hypothetical protein